MNASRPLAPRLLYAVALAGTVVLVVWVIVTWVTQVNPVDFLVYRYGAEALLTGADLYAGNLFGPMMPVGGMPFTYTPFAALVLAPTTLFDSRTAYILWSLLSVAIVGWATHRFTPQKVRLRPLVVVGLTIILSATTMVTQHISFGQINLPLMALVMADVLRTDGGRFAKVVPRGVLVGVAAAIKLTPALFVLYFLLTRQWKSACWSAIGGIGATCVAFLFAPGLSFQFWTDVLWTLNTRVDFSGGGFASYGNNSLQGILAAALPALHALAMPLVLAVGAIVLFIARRVYRQGRHVDAALIVGLSAPLLSPISWIHHWVYLIPAIIVLIFRGSPRIRGVVMLLIPVLIVGPGAGDQLIRDIPALAPLGWMMRESLAAASMLCIILLARAPRVPRPLAPHQTQTQTREPAIESRTT